MNTEVLVDALPYFDVGFDDPGVRETVNSLNNYFCLHSISRQFSIEFSGTRDG